jgi:histidinol-phosphate aminotransferase
MIRPKTHIEKVYRTPGIKKTRMDSLRMDKNEFLPCWPDEWFKDFLNRIRPEHLSIYPELTPLYEKLGHVLCIPKENIVVTAGSDTAIRFCFEVFVEPSDEVIIFCPTFVMYSVYCDIYRANRREIHYDEKIQLDIDKLIGSINKNTKLITIANPNSPTGSVINKKDLLKIIEVSSKFGAVVVIDEAYYPFYEDTMLECIRDFDNLIITRTFSKAAGLAGMRVGFVISNEKISRMIFAVKPMYEVTTLSALLAEYVLDNYDRVFDYAREAREGKDFLATIFVKKGYEVYRGFANFLHVNFGEKKDEIIAFLDKNNVLFKHAFDHPALKQFSSFTIGPKKSLEWFVEIFNRFPEDGTK